MELQSRSTRQLARLVMTPVGWLVVVVLGSAVLAAWSLIYQLIRQQGRLLIRLERLEQASHPDGADADRPKGLPLATPSPRFRLPDIAGHDVALEDFEGRRLLLVHWDPSCTFCGQIAPDLAGLQRDLRNHRTDIVLMSHGDAEPNRRLADEHALDCSILLHPPGVASPLFDGLGTPVAYLLDEKGRVAKGLALGAEEVVELAREAAGRPKRLGERSLAESRLERDGLPAGTRAPSFALPDLAGETVSLDDYRGRRTLLVFSDPECGPCDALAAELAHWEREHRDDLAVVMVTRGGVAENRRKAAEHTVEFPVAIQPGWRVSKQYGIFATPVGFLLDENGIIECAVAKGGPEIFALARSAVREGAPMA
jgi:peroxiredoxin